MVKILSLLTKSRKFIFISEQEERQRRLELAYSKELVSL